MGKVLLVSVVLGTNCNQFGENLLLNQELEEGLILTEFLEDSKCIEGHVDVILILLRKLINEVLNNHVSLLLQDTNHGFLLNSELWLSDLLLFEITVITIP